MISDGWMVGWLNEQGEAHTWNEEKDVKWTINQGSKATESSNLNLGLLLNYSATIIIINYSHKPSDNNQTYDKMF